MARFHLLLGMVMIVLCCTMAQAQHAPSGPPEDVETVIGESETEPQQAFSIADRPIYRAIQNIKKDLNDKFGINFALEDTMIYQHTSGGVDPNDAMVNTLGLFMTWKLYRSEDGKDFAGFGFQGEQRGDPLDGHFTDLRDNLGTLWSPNDSTSDDYAKINQLWWGQKIADGKLGLQIGKIDPGSIINANRFAGSGNTQFFGQPWATNPARSFSDNGLGLQLRAEPTDWLYLHFLMSDSDANSTYSPFKTIHGHWLYAGEIGLKPKFEGLGQGIYRLMVYERDLEDQNEFGWALSFDQNITDNWGVFLRYGDNDGGINSIKRILSVGVSWLDPFGRKNDQAGIGINYTHPTDPTLRDEYAADIFYRFQVTEGFELSADTQIIADPSVSDKESVAVFGVRARFLY
jgi:hypothetical protein